MTGLPAARQTGRIQKRSATTAIRQGLLMYTSASRYQQLQADKRITLPFLKRICIPAITKEPRWR